VLRTKIKIMSSISGVIELLTDMKNRAASLRHQCYVSPIIAMGVIIERYIYSTLYRISLGVMVVRLFSAIKQVLFQCQIILTSKQQSNTSSDN